MISMPYEKLIETLKQLSEIEAITEDDKKRLYLYVNDQTTFKAFSLLLSTHFQDTTYHHYAHDQAILVHTSGELFPLIYRHLSDVKHLLNRFLYESLLESDENPCLWHQIIHHHLIYDPFNAYQTIKKRYNISYKKRLSSAIISFQMLRLDDHYGSLYQGIIEAINQKENFTYVNLIRLYIAGAIDLIFAQKNETYHDLQDAWNQLAQSEDSIDIRMMNDMVALTQNKMTNQSKDTLRNFLELIKFRINN